MNKISGLIILLIIIGSCKKIDVPPDQGIVERDFWLDAIAVTQQKILSVNGGTVNFELEALGMQNGTMTTVYPDQAFLPDTFTGSIIISPVSIQRFEVTQNKSFQSIVLVDASYDWISSSDDGKFIDALNHLKKLTQSSPYNQQFGIGFFGREIDGAPVKFLRSNTNSLFDHSHQEVMQFLTENYPEITELSDCPLYDAISAAADELIAQPLSSNRSITVIVGNNDDAQGTTLNAVIQKCKQNNISVNLISQGYWSYNNYMLAHETGGFIGDNNGTKVDAYYKIFAARTMVYHIYDMLAGNGPRYKITCTVSKPTAWNSNTLVRGFITANYYEEIPGGEFISDDLSLNQLLPVYFRTP